ncbi:hypothetical protein W822_12275 [Advenella kashmirensis W13003]|uniref:Uncharacterized protein n=1 Tax=Advenella kashmirensis W13003 TaxID=1424334 RepID=V8QTK4_9BURK|nr:hypothetical protein W822_12275 [Advenella kashmirensis W13003]
MYSYARPGIFLLLVMMIVIERALSRNAYI